MYVDIDYAKKLAEDYSSSSFCMFVCIDSRKRIKSDWQILLI